MVILDQITKISVKGFDLFGLHHKGMRLGDSLSVIGDFIQITFVENSGMAFGISFGAGKIFLSLFSVFASIALIYYMIKITKYDKYIKLGFALILAGAVGNLIDRVFYGVFYNEGPLFYGNVVDFVQVDIPDIDFMGIHYTHWPVWNIADACITIGVILLLIFNKRIPTFQQLFGKNTNKKTSNEINGNVGN